MIENSFDKGMDASRLRKLRAARRENQTEFWGRFGVTQSRGSRFEAGWAVPQPVLILLKLYFAGLIDDSDLRSARYEAAFQSLDPFRKLMEFSRGSAVQD